jgi:hypothetical protein
MPHIYTNPSLSPVSEYHLSTPSEFGYTSPNSVHKPLIPDSNIPSQIPVASAVKRLEPCDIDDTTKDKRFERNNRGRKIDLPPIPISAAPKETKKYPAIPVSSPTFNRVPTEFAKRARHKFMLSDVTEKTDKEVHTFTCTCCTQTETVFKGDYVYICMDLRWEGDDKPMGRCSRERCMACFHICHDDAECGGPGCRRKDGMTTEKCIKEAVKEGRILHGAYVGLIPRKLAAIRIQDEVKKG